MTYVPETRRDFVKNAALAALGLPLLYACRTETLAQRNDGHILTLLKRNARELGAEGMGAIDVPADVSWTTKFAVGKDEGEPMLISGTVYTAEGKPAPNTLIYFYHTDKFGIYGREGQHKHGKYRSWLLTDDKGRYEFHSIRPASYPNTTFAAHIHMTVTTTAQREDWIDSILFEGDKFISAREREMAGKRGGFDPIVKLETASGVWRGVRDIKLTATAA